MVEFRLNGSASTEDLEWAIVYDGPIGFIGRVVEENLKTGWLILRPAYRYVDASFQLTPGGPQIGMENRLAYPMETCPSGAQAGRSIRASQMTPFADFDEKDRAMFRRLIEKADKMTEELRAKAAGLVLATDVPRGMPLKPGEKG